VKTAALALPVLGLVSLVAPARAGACDRENLPSVLAQARGDRHVLVLGIAQGPRELGVRETAGASGTAVPATLELAGSGGPCGELVLETGKTYLVALGPAKGAAMAAPHGPASARELQKLVRPGDQSRAMSLVREYFTAGTNDARVKALLAFMPFDPALAEQGGRDLKGLATEGAVPPLVVNEMGRRVERESLGNEELSAYLKAARVLKPLWYERVVLSRLSTAKGDRLAIYGAHALAAGDDRTLFVVLKRLRDTDKRTRIAANLLLARKTGQLFGCEQAPGGKMQCRGEGLADWEQWLRQNVKGGKP
jgi:hypothetical protein